jgi:CxxC motif-containing protein (DUF1111 family)
MNARKMVACLALAAAAAAGALSVAVVQASVRRGAPMSAPVRAACGAGMTAEEIDKAYSSPLADIDPQDVDAFYRGAFVFNASWAAPAAGVTQRFSGLGPTFNRTSCQTCHLRNGRNGAPARNQPVFFMSVKLATRRGAIMGPHPTYGPTLEYDSVPPARIEGRVFASYSYEAGRFLDGEPYELRRPRFEFRDLSAGSLGAHTSYSIRLPPGVYGVGLLQSVPTAAIFANADAVDLDRDGISGRVSLLPGARDATRGEAAVGRFGWKADKATVRAQVSDALLHDMGIVADVDRRARSRSDHTGREARPEIDKADFDDLVRYVELLSPPKPSADERSGQTLFEAIGCAACHVTSLPVMRFASRAAADRIRPFTDLLLHDMGEALADRFDDEHATGREWRTPPLWGIGCAELVTPSASYLHDGRARTLTEAILWHGGEGSAARRRFVELAAEDRAAVIAFVRSR